MTGKQVEAIGYMRTSSATNVGDGKDSEARQRMATEGYADHHHAPLIALEYP